MPLLTTINPWPEAQVYVWDIDESILELGQMNPLTESSAARLKSMKSVVHQKGFLSVRALLNQAGLQDRDLYYNHLGKPFLQDGRCISITHSHQRSAIIIAPYPVGIDLELMRPKILRIAHKFSHDPDQSLKESVLDQVAQYTYIWTAKESIYKMVSTPGLSFLHDIRLEAWRSIASSESVIGQAPCIEATAWVERIKDNLKSNPRQFHFKGLVMGDYICGMTRGLEVFESKTLDNH